MKRVYLLFFYTLLSFNAYSQALPSPQIIFPDDCENGSDFPVIEDSALNGANGYYGRLLSGVPNANFNSVNQIISLTMDEFENIYVVGEHNAQGIITYPADIPSFLMKFNQCGEIVWTKEFSETNNNVVLSVYDVEYYGEYVYVLSRGFNFDYTEINQTTFLHKISLDGNEVARAKFPYLIHTTMDIDQTTGNIYLAGKSNKFKVRYDFSSSSEIFFDNNFTDSGSYFFLNMNEDLDYIGWFDTAIFNEYDTSYPLTNFKDSRFLNLSYSESLKNLYFQGNNLIPTEIFTKSGFNNQTTQQNNFVGYFSIDNNQSISFDIQHPYSDEDIFDIAFEESSLRLFAINSEIYYCDFNLTNSNSFQINGVATSMHLLDNNEILLSLSNSNDDHIITKNNTINGSLINNYFSDNNTNSQYNAIHASGEFIASGGFLRNENTSTYFFLPNYSGNPNQFSYSSNFNTGSALILNRIWERTESYARPTKKITLSFSNNSNDKTTFIDLVLGARAKSLKL